MQLPRVVIAATFFVIGSLIAIPAIARTGGDDTSIGRIYWPFAIALMSMLAVAVVLEITLARRSSRQPNRSTEHERLRNAAGLPPSRADIEQIVSQLDKEVSRLQKSLKRLESKGESSKVATDILEIRRAINELEVKITASGAIGAEADRRRATLIEIYGQAKDQLNSSYRIGQVIATIGGGLLFTGVLLALFRPAGHQTAAVLAVIGGSITNLTSAVFFGQTNRARDHLERQLDPLREDARIGELLSHADEVIEKVGDSGRRDDLRAQVVLRILGGTNTVLPSVADLSGPSLTLGERIRAALGRR